MLDTFDPYNYEKFSSIIGKHPDEVGLQIDNARHLLKIAQFKTIKEQRVVAITQAIEFMENSPVRTKPNTWARFYQIKEAAEEWLKDPMLEAGGIKPGKTLITIDNNKLTFGDLIGSGSSCSVYKGKWKSTDVAIKSFTRKEDYLEEISIMVKLNSDYLMSAYDWVANYQEFCIVMKYMTHKNLMHLLEHGGLTLAQKLTIAKDITHGLSDLHDKLFLHRDLKSLNVFIDGKYRARIGDFGQSRIKRDFISCSYYSTPTQMGKYGTLEWKEPLVIKEPSKYDQKSDVYSLGMILWELGTGKKPFIELKEHNSPEVYLAKLADGKKEDLSSIRPECKHLAPIIEKCWADRSARINSKQVLELLMEINVDDTLIPVDIGLSTYSSSREYPSFIS